MSVQFENPAHHRPEPSERSRLMVGKVVTYEGDRSPAGPIECTVTAAEKVFSTITLGSDGSAWSAVRFRLKPTNGKRAFWTASMPDEPLGERVSEVDTSEKDQVTP